MVTRSTPAVVVAAPSSGSGKTTIATGLMGALRRAGLAVAPFKVGADYIDPGYHRVAAARTGRNLDAVLCGAETIAPLFKYGSHGCDIAVVEGVMGLFDGRIALRSASDVADGSTAQVAQLLGAPIVIVIDARGQSQSVAAVVHGFATLQPGLKVGGVILNRVASDRHEAVLRDSCARVGVPVLGVLRSTDALAVPSRHLGLVPAAEHQADAERSVSAMIDMVSAHVDLKAIVELAYSSNVITAPAWSPAAEQPFASGADVCDDLPAEGPVIAIAGGPAFTFSYAEHAEMLTARGARVVHFDPRFSTPSVAAAHAGIERTASTVRASGLRAVDAVVIGGGFPEFFAEELAANDALHAELGELARQHVPIHAECAGLLLVAHSLDGHQMAGLVPVHARFGNKLRLGYRNAVALSDSPLWNVGHRTWGHEFHRTFITDVEGRQAAPCGKPDHNVRYKAWAWRDDVDGAHEDGCVVGSVHASYLHTHPVGNVEAVDRFIAAARRHRNDWSS